MKARYSERDDKGKLLVDCSECKRGGNGTGPNKCGCGWEIKTGRQGNCPVGELLEGIEVEAA